MNLRKLGDLFARTPLHPQWLVKVAALSRSLRSQRGVVLDVGCASQWARDQLAAEAHYIPLDYPKTAQTLYGSKPTVFGDVQRLPFVDGSVDAVICREVLEHVGEPESALRELYRVLKSGGVAECSMPFMYPAHDEPYDYTRWTVHAWRMKAQQSGFVLTSIDPPPHQLHCAAVLFGLAMTAPLRASPWAVALPLVPLAAVLVSAANLSAWTLAWIWPRWDAMTIGYRVLLTKP